MINPKLRANSLREIALSVRGLLAFSTATFAVTTAVVPDWIDTLTGADPDHGNGTFEILIVLSSLTTALILTVCALRPRRRAAGLIR